MEDKEPERYYEWMLWRFRQEEKKTPIQKLQEKLSLEERVSRIEKHLGITRDNN